MADLVASLRTPDTELRQTHISWVFLRGDEVLKVKKPVDFGFLDFTTPDRRRAMCQAEVEVNARLSPDVYLGVVPLTVDERGRYRVGGPGPPVDWAVRMRRLPDADRADLRLARGTLTDAHLQRIATDIAAFHRRCETSAEIAAFGTPARFGVNVVENFEQTRDVLGEYLAPAEAAEVERWQRAFLAERGDVFAARIDAGHVRDGHGDLRLEHLYLDDQGQLRVLDAIEFNDRFRYADTAADLAFLSMDLRWRGRADLAERVVALYAREADDYDLYTVLDFYESYRAFVRGKIATFVAADPATPADALRRAQDDARSYFKLALATERRVLLPPMVVAVGGLIAAGKSTIADALSAELGAPVVDSDRTRKHMLGVEATTHVGDASWKGAYDPRFTERVYDEVFRRAAVVLASGRPVIVDASFRSRSMRARARALAAAAGVPLRVVECRADRPTAMARLEERERRDDAVSDGTRAVYDDFAARWEPIVELGPGEHVLLDTRLPLSTCLDSLHRHVPTWPVGLAG